MLKYSSNARARGVSFDEGPLLVARHDPAPVAAAEDQDHTAIIVGQLYHPPPDGPRGGGEADDSLETVASVNTGAGRAHTPLRGNRTHTPQSGETDTAARTSTHTYSGPRSSSLLHTAAAPVQVATPRGEGDARRQPRGRRKQRRWENDNLIGVERFLRGRYSQEEGEASHLTVSHTWRSSLSILVSDQSTSADVIEARERVRNGLQPKHSAKQGFHNPGSRHFAGGKWADAEERFLLVERRLRDVVVRALRSAEMMSFVSGLETLLEAFAQRREVETADVGAALAASLMSRPTVEGKVEGDSKGKGSGEAATETTLLVPLGPSPFHRLLLHALCQYWKLRSRSEETGEGRIVRVSTPPTSRKVFSLPNTFLAEFVFHARLRRQTAAMVSTSCRRASSTLASGGSGSARQAASKAVEVA
ncbi:unnamed protein product [Ascophyllum nodosum]